MNIRELLTSRHEGVVIDRPSHTLIEVSQPSQQARMTRMTIGVILAVISGVVAGQVFDGIAAFIAAFVIGGGIYFLLHSTPAARTRYTSWEYPEDYNLFEDTLIRDRFYSHRDEFTLVED